MADAIVKSMGNADVTAGKEQLRGLVEALDHLRPYRVLYETGGDSLTQAAKAARTRS